MARRKYTREFKVSAVQLVQQQGYTIPQAAQSLGVDDACIRYWIKQLGQDPGLAPQGEGALAAENRRLRQDNARLLMERDILKKAAAFFAKEQP